MPSCRRCNGESGARETEVFERLAVCVDPRKIAAAGISKKALISFGLGAGNLTDGESRIRRKRGSKVFENTKPYSAEIQPHVVPGMGPHPEVPAAQQLQILIPAKTLHEVAKKIVRGCEYWLSQGRIVEPPYEIEAFFAESTKIPHIVQLFDQGGGPVHLGPGFKVRRLAPVDDPLAAIYQIVIWDSLTIYASILAPEVQPSELTKP